MNKEQTNDDCIVAYKSILDLRNHMYILRLPSVKRILNIGAGEGDFVSMYLYAPEAEITNIDIYKQNENATRHPFERCIEKYNNFSNVKNIWCDVTDMSRFEDDSFDMVIFNNVIEYLAPHQLDAAFSEIKRVLTQNSTIQIGISNRKVRSSFIISEDTIKEYNYDEMQDILKKYQFHIDSASGLVYFTSEDDKVYMKDMLIKDLNNPDESIGIWFMCKNKKAGTIEMAWPKEKKINKISLPDGYKIRKFKGGDKKEYIKFLNTNNDLGEWDDTRLKFRMRNILFPDGVFFITYKEKIIATACALDRSANKNEKRAELGWVLVDPKHRGKKLGTIISMIAMEYMLEKGYENIFLITDSYRTSAIKVYLKLGFIPEIGSEKDKIFWENFKKLKICSRETTNCGK